MVDFALCESDFDAEPDEDDALESSLPCNSFSIALINASNVDIFADKGKIKESSDCKIYNENEQLIDH